MARILIIEDQEANLDMLTRRLQRAGFEIHSARTGLEGLTRARDARPDLILMDLSLPDGDGRDFTRQLKSDPGLASLPVIALTAHAMAADRERALEAGCDDFDTKPVDLPRLLTKIHALLETRHD